MEFLKPGAGIAVAATIGAVALSPASPLWQGTAPDRPASVWRVLDAGRDTGCSLAFAGAPEDGRRPLALSAACAVEVPLAGIRYWNDRDDGTVELSDAAGAPAMRLTAGDGVAFEAFGDGAPLMVLVAKGE